MTCLLAQLSDMHIREPGRLAYGRLDTAPYLRTAVDSILALKQRPDAVVLTGDLTDFGRVAEYEHLARLLAPLPMPLYLLPGNHDDRVRMRESFPQHNYLGSGEFVNYAVDLGGPSGLRLLALDTIETGQSGGRMCRARLDWIDAELARSRGRAIVVAMHHPPFTTLIGHMDRIGLLEGSGELREILSRHPNVERVICGHLHRTILAQFGGTLVSTVPSPAHQVCLDLDEQAPSAWALEPPGFHLHAWTDPGRLVTHAVAAGSFAGPFPFHENGALID